MDQYAPKSNRLLISMHQNYMWHLILIFTLVFELVRPQKFGNVQTNRHVIVQKWFIFSTNSLILFLSTTFWQNSYYLEKYNLFDVHLLGLFCRPNGHSLAQFFFIKLASAVFEIFRKKEAKKKKHFSFTFTILDHTYMVK